MKIKTEKDVQKLDDRIKSEFGVSFNKYKNTEVTEKFIGLLVFPKFALNCALRPISISIFLYFIVFFISDLNFISTIIYGVSGLLFFINGLLLGVLLVLWEMKKDIYSVIEYSLNILKECIIDLNNVSLVTSEKNRQKTINLLFLGIIHIVTIPIITETLSKKIPLIGGFFSKLSKEIIHLATSRIKFKYDSNKNELINNNTTIVTNSYITSIDSSILRLNKLLSTVLRIIQMPFIIAAIINSFLLIVLLYVIA